MMRSTDNKPNLLMINSSLTNGGSEHVMVILANEFANRGYEIDMLICNENAPETYILDRRVKKNKFKSNGVRGIRFTLGWLQFIRTYQRKKKYCAVISFVMGNNILTLLAGIGCEQKIIVSERANPLLADEYGRLFKLAEKITYPFASYIIFQTEDVMNYYKQSIKNKGVVIPNPVSPNILEQWRGDREKTIVSTGRLTDQKNYPLLLKAFQKFNNACEGYKLVIYGQGALLGELQELTRELGIIQYVKFAGFIENVNEYVRKASMFVLASDYEGISNAMIEALAMGVPTICTDCPVGGARMMIKNGVNGLLVPVGDVDALYGAMIRIAENPDFAQKLGNEALRVRENYRIEKIADKWEEIVLA